MMPGHGGNPIFFNKKIKIGRPEHSLTPHSSTFDNISFLPYPPSHPQRGRHMCITSYAVTDTEYLGLMIHFFGFFDSNSMQTRSLYHMMSCPKNDRMKQKMAEQIAVKSKTLLKRRNMTSFADR